MKKRLFSSMPRFDILQKTWCEHAEQAGASEGAPSII